MFATVWQLEFYETVYFDTLYSFPSNVWCITIFNKIFNFWYQSYIAQWILFYNSFLDLKLPNNSNFTFSKYKYIAYGIETKVGSEQNKILHSTLIFYLRQSAVILWIDNSAPSTRNRKGYISSNLRKHSELVVDDHGKYKPCK